MTTKRAVKAIAGFPYIERQSGQVLVLSLLLLGVALIGLVRFFHVGQVAAAKAKQTHALDAAAYSGALVQARALNTLSYINRAQLGHHIAMAHLVTLGSWAMLAGNEAKQLARGNPPAHLITMLFGDAHGKAYRAAAKASGLDGMARSHADLATAYEKHDELISRTFIEAQQKMVASLPKAREQMMQEVLARNYPDFVSASGHNASTEYSDRFELEITEATPWRDFLALQGPGKLAPFVKQIAGLYRFLDPRDHTARNNWVVDARCPGKRHQLRRRGRTEMDATGRWQSIDTQSFHALRSNRWIGCYYR